MAVRVPFTFGPVDSALLVEWTSHVRTLVTAVRRNRHSVSITVRDDLLDLIEALFDIWELQAARSPEFLWSTETDTDQVEHIVDQWLEIGSLTDDELARLGLTWAPRRTQPVAAALVKAATMALVASDGRGPMLAERLNR